jgi:hypothetical protein
VTQTEGIGALARRLLGWNGKHKRNPGVEAWAKRTNDIKMTSWTRKQTGIALEQLKLKTLNDNPYDSFSI